MPADGAKPEPAVPDEWEGADSWVRYTLAKLCKVTVDAAAALEDAREQFEIARMCHYEAVMAERSLQRLVDGEMYFESIDQPLDAEVYGLYPPQWAASPAVEPRKEPDGIPPIPLPTAPNVEGRSLRDKARIVMDALPALWGPGETPNDVVAKDIAAALKVDINWVYAGVAHLAEIGSITIEPRKLPGQASFNLIRPPKPPPAHCAPVISDRKLERARELMAKGNGVRAVAAMVDVTVSDLQAALLEAGIQ